jgi:nicotinamide-nucleotide amidase
MAEGALAASRAQVAISITGFTEGGPGQPAGLVHLACAGRGRSTTHTRASFGDIGRADVRLGALRVALSMMRDQLRPAADAA